MSAVIQQILTDVIKRVQENFQDVVDMMPNEATNDAQRALQAKHGTPREFAEACVNAIGTISCDEAIMAIKVYAAKWESAA